MLKELFGTTKAIIAMAHLPPLPGAPGYDARRGIAGIVERVARDMAALESAGVDAILFGNEGDRPYVLKASPEGLAAMTAVVATLAPGLKVPFGVDYLWDPVATVALATATGARFAREVFTGVYDSDMGLWQPDCAGALRLRRNLGRDDLKLLFNVNAEFAAPLGERAIERKAESAVFSALADAVCVSGPMTGQAVATSDLDKVKGRLPATPVFANTGVTVDNVAAVLGIADGAVVGTHFKKDGVTWNPVDPARAGRFMDVVRRLR
ncbi:MAG: BtpA/SgcQ family protein [Alphaproteobacteria bacterium]